MKLYRLYIKPVDVYFFHIGSKPAFKQRSIQNQLNIYDGAFLQKQLAGKGISLFLQKTQSQMFNWVSNTPLINAAQNVKEE